MVRTGWEWDLAIPPRSVGACVVRRAGMAMLSGLFGGETLSGIIVNIIVGYFWGWSFFAFCGWWRWSCGSAANRGRKEARGDGEMFYGLGAHRTQVLIIISEITQ